MTDPTIAIQQADLILKLYEMRREPVMRLARGYVGGAFRPRSASEFISIVTAGNQQSAYVLQVYGYWDMVAALALHGSLASELVYHTCPEMYFQFAKIRHFLEDLRIQLHLPEIFQSLQKLAEGSPEGRARLDNMEKHLDLSSEPAGASQTLAASDI